MTSSRDRERQGVPAWQPNLTWITDHLAVGGRFPPERTEHLAQEIGIAAVIDLRSEDRDDEVLLKRHGIAFLHLPTDDHGAVTPAMIADGIAFACPYLDRRQRVLVHCEHGIGRSATLALCIMVERGFAPLEALMLAKDKRALVSPSPAQFACWTQWMKALRKSRRVDWELPSFDAFKAIAYRHLGQV
ncbi:MAG TPA: dual specificity protein phosphatase family protein [Enterovirga sp.]